MQELQLGLAGRELQEAEGGVKTLRALRLRAFLLGHVSVRQVLLRPPRSTNRRRERQCEREARAPSGSITLRSDLPTVKLYQ